MNRETILQALLTMSRELGKPELDHVILGEGNTSARLDDRTFFVKGSGEQLGRIQAEGFVEVDMARALALLEGAAMEGEALKQALLGTKVDPEAPGRPSIEVLMHAVALQVGGARFVGHTHTSAVTGLLCSEQAKVFTHARIFPDQVVLCGPDSAFVPYADPGLPLGIAVHQSIVEFQKAYNISPKVIMLQNHGIVVLGQSAKEVEQILAMATKAARIYAAAAMAGDVVPMPPEEIDHLYNRADEHYRRAKLMGA